MIWTVFFWISAALCVLLPIYGILTRNKRQERLDGYYELSKRDYTIWTIIALIITVAVRVYAFGTVPGGMNQDGAMAAVDANALAQYGTDRFGMSWPVHLTAWGYGQMSSMLSYLMIPFIRLFGLNIITARLPNLVCSIIGMVFLYLLVRRVFGRRAALIVTFICAINPWHIMQSRWALDCNLFPHFLIAAMYFLVIGLDRRVFLFISMIFFGLSMYCYGIALFAVPLLLLILCIYFVATRRIQVSDAIICFVLYLLVSWPIYAMTVINALSLQTIAIGPFTIPYFPDSMRTNDIIFFSQDKLTQLKENANSLVNVVIRQIPDWAHNSIASYGAVYLFSGPFIVLGGLASLLGFSKKSESDDTARAGRVILFVWLIVSALVGIVFNDININRINLIFYVLIIYCAIGIDTLMDCAWPKAVAAITALMFGFSFCSFTFDYFESHSQVLAYDNSAGLKEAFEFTQRQKPKKIFVTVYPKDWYSPDSAVILTMFYEKIDAQYFQGKVEWQGTDGTKWLPFNQRYVFIDYNYQDVTETSECVYILRSNEIDNFDASKFDLRAFDDFYVAVPRDLSST